jgi:hypothetical protein
MAKLFWPTLVGYLHTVCVYIVKYKPTMVAVLPDGAGVALDGIVTACEVFMALVPSNTAP